MQMTRHFNKAWHYNNAIDVYSIHYFVPLIYKKTLGMKYNPVCAKSLQLISSGFQWNTLTLMSFDKLLTDRNNKLATLRIRL